MGASEGFGPLKGGPEAHAHAGQVQLPRHHQAVAPVVARPHQHQGRRRRLFEQPAGDRQGRLFHQGFHRQTTGEQLVLQRRHLAPRHEQMVGISRWPARTWGAAGGLWQGGLRGHGRCRG